MNMNFWIRNADSVVKLLLTNFSKKRTNTQDAHKDNDDDIGYDDDDDSNGSFYSFNIYSFSS